MKKILDYTKAKEKYGMDFETFIKYVLNVEKRPELNTDGLSLKGLRFSNQKDIDALLDKHSSGIVEIVGDYDVDGVCATAIMMKALKVALPNAKLIPAIPNRFTDGYGLNSRIVEDATKNGVNLIITVDNGIVAKDAIEIARNKNIDVIVTDHHHPDVDKMPNANVIINPHLEGNLPSRTKNICGAMVAFLICRAVLEDKKLLTKNLLRELAELAAIATICDVMPLEYENRLIVKYLLNMMHRNEDANLGISKLMSVLKNGRFEFNTESISFGIGPALNAAGRLDTAFTSYNLLMETVPSELERYANEVDRLNNLRKSLTNQLVALSYQQLNLEDSVNILYFDDISEGIIGIVAGKICESTNKPTYVFTNNKEKNIIKGSGRSPFWCNLIEVSSDILNSMEDALGFGGHAGAMGLSFKNVDALAIFKAELDKKVRLMNRIEPEIIAIRFPKDMTLKEAKDIVSRFEPFGEGLREPLFVCRTPINYLSLMGENHTRFSGFLNGEKADFYYFFNTLDESYNGKMVDCFFTINKSVAETTGSETFSIYVKDVIAI